MVWKNERELVLAVETSCDETSVAIVERQTRILSNIVASQIKSHQRFGGIVPEVASRHHVEQITQMFEEALREANVSVEEISAVAVTNGPGLVGSLLIGICAAKAFAFVNDLPLIAVNHMAGHIYAAKLVEEFDFPLLALLVSGGHTELVYMKKDGEYVIIGETRDDAVGEAYDKVGRVMGLKYPAGREIDELAHQGKETFSFPRAMLQEDNFDFSFSGLKSSFINTVHQANQKKETLDKKDLSCSFQEAVTEVLVEKTIRALKKFGTKTLIVAGGVAANQGLRKKFSEKLQTENLAIHCIFPPLSLCGDNAAMIAAAAYVEIEKGKLAPLCLNADPSLSFDVLGEEK